ncbi:alpha/beta hydrolase [Mycobacterium sp.]|uniref:alpha/beta hydrolase n=1 Tax=Mycobacterium sp. TaxID=1785 RepID=UPI003BAAAEC8
MTDGVAETLRALDAGFPAVETMTPAQVRATIADRHAALPVVAQDVGDVQERSIAGPNGLLRLRIYYPPALGTRAAVVFCHGGGFVFCSLDTHDAFCRAMCANSAVVVISVDYALAPENRAPAAVLDAFAAFCWAVDYSAELGVAPSRILVAGDSAGANLAAAVAIHCREQGLMQPAGQLLLYPALDPSCDTASYRAYATGYYNTRAAMRWYWHHYLGAQPLPKPAYLVAPARAESHSGLAPAVVVTAGLDPLHSEGVDYARALRAAGVLVLQRDYPGLFHGFMTMMSLPAAAAARELLWMDLRRLVATAETLGPQP